MVSSPPLSHESADLARPGDALSAPQRFPPGAGSRVKITEVEFPAHGSIALDATPLPDADQHVWVLEGALELRSQP